MVGGVANLTTFRVLQVGAPLTAHWNRPNESNPKMQKKVGVENCHFQQVQEPIAPNPDRSHALGVQSRANLADPHARCGAAPSLTHAA